MPTRPLQNNSPATTPCVRSVPDFFLSRPAAVQAIATDRNEIVMRGFMDFPNCAPHPDKEARQPTRKSLMPVKPLILAALITVLASAGYAQGIPARDGWAVADTTKTYEELIGALKSAVKANGMGVVTQAGPTKAAAGRGITIPGNRVIGVFNNDFAVRVLQTSTAAMIEAPIRFYITENTDGTTTLSYKTPSHVFAPYLPEGGDQLAILAGELDARFATIAAAASQ